MGAGPIVVHARQHSVAEVVEIKRAGACTGEHSFAERVLFFRILLRVSVEVACLDIRAGNP